MTPPENTQDQLRANLTHAMDELRAADQDGDETLLFYRTRAVLHAIYDLEQFESKGHRKAFIADCKKSNPGRTLLAVVWIRNQVVHNQQTFIDSAWHPLPYPRPELPPDVETVVWQFGWPLRKQMPGGRDGRGWDVMYERLVEGKTQFPPLETAQSYLLSLP